MGMNQVTTHTMQTLSETLIHKFTLLLPTIVASFTIFGVIFLIALLARGIVRRVFGRLTTYQPLVELAAKITYVSLVILAVITGLGTAGVNINAMVASLGLFGFTLGFAFKDLLSNTLAGVMILFYRPFKIGDAINGKDFAGKVEEINLRYTILKGENQKVLIPNSNMLNNIVNINI